MGRLLKLKLKLLVCNSLENSFPSVMKREREKNSICKREHTLFSPYIREETTNVNVLSSTVKLYIDIVGTSLPVCKLFPCLHLFFCKRKPHSESHLTCCVKFLATFFSEEYKELYKSLFFLHFIKVVNLLYMEFYFTDQI